MAAVHEDGRRIDYLARHRTIVAEHIPDRRSVYWVDRQPLGPPTVMAMTPRLEILSKSRHLLNEYQFNRDRDFNIDKESFYKEIKPTNKNVPEASDRVVVLSAHKKVPSNYLYDRLLPLPVKVPPEASPRIEELARSKTDLWEKKGGWPNEKMFYNTLPQPVNSSAMKASATARVETLAEAKKVPESFKPEKPIRWEILEDTLKTNASLRVSQLARPRSRTLIKDDGFDPYQVSKSARFAQITPRVEELAVPLPRKKRSKKTV